MTPYHQLAPPGIPLVTAFRLRFAGFVSSVGARIASWIAAAANYYEAAAMYEQLSRLSDAELQRRGLSRDTLARHICQAREHTSF